jgi:hypothetical protein
MLSTYGDADVDHQQQPSGHHLHHHDASGKDLRSAKRPVATSNSSAAKEDGSSMCVGLDVDYDDSAAVVRTMYGVVGEAYEIHPLSFPPPCIPDDVIANRPPSVLVAPLPPVRTSNGKLLAESSIFASILRLSLQEALGHRVGAVTICGEVARVEMTSPAMERAALDLGSFMCLECEVLIAFNDRVVDPPQTPPLDEPLGGDGVQNDETKKTTNSHREGNGAEGGDIDEDYLPRSPSETSPVQSRTPPSGRSFSNERSVSSSSAQKRAARRRSSPDSRPRSPVRRSPTADGSRRRPRDSDRSYTPRGSRSPPRRMARR